MYLNGAKKCVAVDYYPVLHKNEEELNELIFNYLASNLDKILFSGETMDSNSLVKKMGSLFKRSPSGGYLLRKEIIQFQFPVDAAGMPFNNEEFDLIYSNAAMEHFKNLPDAIQECGRVTRSGGFNFHIVDYRDHQSFDSPWEFLIHSKEKWEGFAESEKYYTYTNRMRHSQVVKEFEKAGFALEKIIQQIQKPFPAENRKKLHSEFQDLSNEDLETISGTYWFRKI